MSSTTDRTLSTCCLYLGLLAVWFCTLEQKAFASTADIAGINAEISSVTINPASTPVGTYPEIKAVIQNTSKKSSSDGKASFDIKLLLTLPDKTTKLWTWRNNKFSADQKMQFKAPQDFNIKQSGSYTVEYSVFIAGASKPLTSRTESFSTINPAAAPKPVASAPKLAATADARKKPKDPDANLKAPKPSSSAPKHAGTDRNTIGIGIHFNTVNVSAGPALMFWPMENAGLEITYGLGFTTTYEVRGMYRFQPVMTISPYVGAGYLHAEKKETLLQTDITMKGESFSIFGGIERALYSKLHAYAELSLTPLKLGSVNVNTATNNSSQNINYIPVTVGIGILWYVF